MYLVRALQSTGSGPNSYRVKQGRLYLCYKGLKCFYRITSKNKVIYIPERYAKVVKSNIYKTDKP